MDDNLRQLGTKYVFNVPEQPDIKEMNIEEIIKDFCEDFRLHPEPIIETYKNITQNDGEFGSLDDIIDTSVLGIIATLIFMKRSSPEDLRNKFSLEHFANTYRLMKLFKEGRAHTNLERV